MSNDKGTITIETERLILRRFTLEDARGMYENFASDPETNKYIYVTIPTSVEETREIIKVFIYQYGFGNYNWIIELKETGEVIGNIEAVRHFSKNRVCDVGYEFGSKYWNHGYATEALKAVINYLFEDEDIEIITASHMSRNPASGRVMEKAGMIKKMVIQRSIYDKNTHTRDDEVFYTIFNSDYFKNKKKII